MIETQRLDVMQFLWKFANGCAEKPKGKMAQFFVEQTGNLFFLKDFHLLSIMLLFVEGKDFSLRPFLSQNLWTSWKQIILLSPTLLLADDSSIYTVDQSFQQEMEDMASRKARREIQPFIVYLQSFLSPSQHLTDFSWLNALKLTGRVLSLAQHNQPDICKKLIDSVHRLFGSHKLLKDAIQLLLCRLRLLN